MKNILYFAVLVFVIAGHPVASWAGPCQALTGNSPGSVCTKTNMSGVNYDPVCRQDATAYETCYLRDCYGYCSCEPASNIGDFDCCAWTAEMELSSYRLSLYGTDKVAVYKYPDNTGKYTCNAELIGYKCLGGYYGASASSASGVSCKHCSTLLTDNDDAMNVTSYGPTADDYDSGWWSWEDIATEEATDCFADALSLIESKAGTYYFTTECHYKK